MVREKAEGIPAIEIVGIDCREWLVDYVFGGEDGLSGSPRPLPCGRDREPLRQVIQFLKDVINRDPPFEPGTDGFPKRRLDFMADDKNQVAKSGTQGVEHRVVDDRFAAGADGIDLLEAAVAAADACSHHEERRLTHLCYVGSVLVARASVDAVEESTSHFTPARVAILRTGQDEAGGVSRPLNPR